MSAALKIPLPTQSVQLTLLKTHVWPSQPEKQKTRKPSLRLVPEMIKEPSDISSDQASDVLFRYTDPSGLVINNPLNVPGVPNSCGSTPIQTYYEPLEASSTPVTFTGGAGPIVPYAPGIYGLTWGDINSSSTVNIDINTSMNPSSQTLNNTLVHEGTHGLGGDEDVAYPVGDALYPQNSSP